MQQHTQEPWIIGGEGSEHHINVNRGGKIVNILQAYGDDTTIGIDKANAARAVDCVNAMAGHLHPEKWSILMNRITDENGELLAQIHELLSVLRKIEEGFESGKITQEHYDLATNTLQKYPL